MMPQQDIELVERAQKRNGRLRLAAAVVFVCVWGDCILYGGWWGLALGWISALFLVALVVLIIGFETDEDR